jgi:hypothetical protein
MDIHGGRPSEVPASTPPTPADPIQPLRDSGHGRIFERKSLQDLLFKEGLDAAKLARQSGSLEDLQTQLVKQFGQNSMETRVRYAQSVLRWFFHDGIDGLAKSVWLTYADEQLETDILRHLYLTAEPIMGACVADALFPLENGMLIPPEYFDRFLRNLLGEEAPPKTRKLLKTNLMRLGFLARSQGKPDRLNPVVSNKISLLILVHALFAADGPRTIELRHLLASPFWKYLGYKSEDAVRGVLREADAAKLVGKYVVADQLEQITTCFTLKELLARKARL